MRYFRRDNRRGSEYLWSYFSDLQVSCMKLQQKGRDSSKKSRNPNQIIMIGEMDFVFFRPFSVSREM